LSGKIGLLTLPLSDNFGGMLQIIALYQLLTREGYDVVFLDKHNLRTPIKEMVAKVLEKTPLQNYSGIRGRYQARLRHMPSLNKYMPKRSRKVRSGKDLEAEISRLGIDTIIVGSDQVWRFEYQGDGAELNYFLDFGGPDLKRISYAASFGHASWKYPDRRDAVARLLQKFDAISVRENTGIDIVHNCFGREQVQRVLDPTALLPRDFYEILSDGEPAQPGILCYAIDQGEKVDLLISGVEASLAKPGTTARISPHDASTSIATWLRRFRDADYVLTDSFHGVIFSILFERNFLVTPNVDRGLDRFLTILGHVGLENRIIETYDKEEIARKIDMPIDYAAVRERLAAARTDSLSFLRANLS
jgi:hypothetical protein